MVRLSVEHLDDFDGSKVTCGTVICNSKYQLIKNIGEGSFGSVWLANNARTGQKVAIKIPCDPGKETWLSFQVECLTLLGVVESDRQDEKNCLRIKDAFYIRNSKNQEYFIIVNEILGSSLRNLLDAKLLEGAEGFSTQIVKQWVKQILTAMQFLHSDLGVVHMDLKPENVLLQRPNLKRLSKNQVKLVDFGSAQKPGTFWSCFVPQTPYYRSPEALLGYSCSASMDMWSLGCMTYELLTCEPLFHFKDARRDNLNQQLLQQMIQLLGYPPKKFALGGFYSKEYFTKSGKLQNLKINFNKGCLRSLLTDRHSHLFQKSKDLDTFVDFISMCLQWNPAQRMTAQEALQHPWINNQCLDNKKRLPRKAGKSNSFKLFLESLVCVKSPPQENIYNY
eukprot:TRINITY_DN21916_c0_g2_i2.p1 TRINITY_DN21916_c0_g2~~TRINITY_DN21916_c0_g2_i2.p1  ORF type:complete len:393 (-),score=29.67 TRINITY_DN21916_c0_g2_i2:929-2107(-)